jgi:hypothetical protein
MRRGVYSLYAIVVCVVATFINLAMTGGSGTSSSGWSSGGGSGYTSGGSHK